MSSITQSAQESADREERSRPAAANEPPAGEWSGPQAAIDVSVDLNDARPRRWGWMILVLGIGGFLAWALLAPLDAGVAAAGQVVVSGNRKAVQSLAAGRVAAILVRDGDQVQTGQVLVRLDPTTARSQFEVAHGQWLSTTAVEARLSAERLGRPAFVFPPELARAQTDPRAASAMALQTQLFKTRRQAFLAEMTIYRENILGLEAQLQGLEEASRSKKEQLRLLSEELKHQRGLAEDGFLPRNRVLEQQRLAAGISGAIAEDIGNIGRTRQQIAELKARMLGREQDFRKEVESQLTDVQKEVTALSSRLQALEFELANTEIKSPSEGIVVGLAVHTVGGVIGAGTPLMEIVPESEPLKIEAQIPPHMIDKVHAGLDVDILFPAFQQSTTPHIPGKVTLVSADVLVEPRQGHSYFKANVEVTPEGMKKLVTHHIRAGMPAEVFVRTGERTLFNYITKPLLDRLNRSLTEP